MKELLAKIASIILSLLGRFIKNPFNVDLQLKIQKVKMGLPYEGTAKTTLVPLTITATLEIPFPYDDASIEAVTNEMRSQIADISLADQAVVVKKRQLKRNA